MRKLIFAIIAAAIAGVPVATVVKAEDTTVIHKNGTGMGDHKTIIKKHDEGLVGPREDKKVIIQHNHD